MDTLKSRLAALRTNPVVMGSLGTLAGLTLGLAGRWLRHRMAPDARVIVIEAF